MEKDLLNMVKIKQEIIDLHCLSSSLRASLLETSDSMLKHFILAELVKPTTIKSTEDFYILQNKIIYITRLLQREKLDKYRGWKEVFSLLGEMKQSIATIINRLEAEQHLIKLKNF